MRRQQILEGLIADKWRRRLNKHSPPKFLVEVVVSDGASRVIFKDAINDGIYKRFFIIFRERLFGRALPCSHFRSVVGSTSRRSAKAFWVSPSILRAASNLSASDTGTGNGS